MLKKYKVKDWQLVLLIVLLISGCSKQLDQQPISDLAESNFYNNSNDFVQAVNGVYSKLTTYPSQALWLGEMRSDNLNALHDGNRDWQGINDFLPTITTTGFILDAWRDNFNGIFNANSTLEALLTKGDVITDADLRTRLEGEVRFLRAFYYFQLIRLYGAVPFIDTPLSADEVASVARTNPEKIYPLIIEDLAFAAANLPTSYTGDDIGRVTSFAAKGLLGIVYLTRSAPTYGIIGAGLASGEYDQALELFDEIIQSGQFDLLDKYEDIFAYNNENNVEVLFDVQFMSSSNGASFPSHLVPVAFWLSQGISNAYGNGFGSSNFTVSTDLINSYASSAASGQDNRENFNIRLDYANPFIQKYIDLNGRGIDGRDWPVNFIVIRYTDVLLLKAECILHGAGGGSTQEALNLVNQVRQRAGVPLLTTITPEDLLEERRREFLGEGLRWNDLIRFGKPVEIMNAWRLGDDLPNIQEVDANALIYPVPAEEIAVKGGLYTQNLGY